jgi:hypothetical protein
MARASKWKAIIKEMNGRYKATISGKYKDGFLVYKLNWFGEPQKIPCNPDLYEELNKKDKVLKFRMSGDNFIQEDPNASTKDSEGKDKEPYDITTSKLVLENAHLIKDLHLQKPASLFETLTVLMLIIAIVVACSTAIISSNAVSSFQSSTKFINTSVQQNGQAIRALVNLTRNDSMIQHQLYTYLELHNP